MKNIYAGQGKKKIPKTLEECLRCDVVSQELWNYASGLEKIGIILATLISIFGIIIFFALLAIASDLRLDGEFVIAFIVLGIFGLVAFSSYISYHTKALQFAAWASIIHSTNVTANLTIYNTTAKQGDKLPEEYSSAPKEKQGVCAYCHSIFTYLDGEMIEKCPNCGENLSNQLSECGCPYCDGKNIMVSNDGRLFCASCNRYLDSDQK